MRHPTAVLATLGLFAATACGSAGELVDDARSQVSEAAETVTFCVSALELAAAVERQDVDAIVAAGEGFVRDAPDEIRPDAQLVLEAGRRARNGETEALATPEVRAAGESVRAFTTDRCNPASDDA